MNRTVSMLTLAVIGSAVAAFPYPAAADSQRPNALVPPGWSARDGRGGFEYFLPPGATTADVCETIFPTQKLDRSLEDTAAAVWRPAIAGERLVDAKSQRITVTDGAPAYRVVIATVNSQNQGVYRVFVFKQYGQTVAAGEFRFSDIAQIEAIGAPAISSLESMSERK